MSSSRKRPLALSRSSQELVSVEASSFEGPIPPPALLEGYERVTPGAADRILSMAERQAAHRQELEKTVTERSLANEDKGIRYGFILSFLLMAFGFFLILRGKDAAGYLAVFAPVILRTGSQIVVNRKKDEAE